MKNLKIYCNQCLENNLLITVNKNNFSDDVVSEWLAMVDCTNQHNDKSFTIEDEVIAFVQPSFMDKVLSWFTA